MAGANSVFHGERLLTTPNPQAQADARLFERLGLVPMPGTESAALALDETAASTA